MGQLTITLSDELEDKIREEARTGNYDSVSDYMRELILNSKIGSPTFWQRCILINQLELSEKLGSEINYRQLDALRNGYTQYYSDNNVEKDELTEENAKFVHRVLEMYGHIQDSFTLLEDKSDLEEEDLYFPGFDGNASDGYLHYLGFLIKHGNYEYVKPLDKVNSINSHSSVNDMYQRMLDKYNSINRNLFRRLNVDEIKDILNERIHPENRSD